jgi:hypothetical protein
MPFHILANGVTYSGSSIVINIGGVSLPSLKAVKFRKKANKNNNHGAGQEVIDRTYGKNEYEASITVKIADLGAIENASPDFDPTNLPPFDIVIGFIQGTKAAAYTLYDCEFTEWGIDAKTDDKEIMVEMPLIISHFKRTR